MPDPTAGPRARYREQVRAEVREHAWSQITEAGAPGLSLKAIAQRMGMTAPALYRYFASRDELLTELILSAYLDLAETVEAAAEAAAESTAVDGDDPARQVRAFAGALRTWAVSAPQRYLLLYGTPVPGYAAPPEATDLARRIAAPVQSAFAARVANGTSEGPSLTSGSRAGPARREQQALDLMVRLWTRLHGVLGLELAGHFDTMPVDPAALYAHELDSVLDA
jgi:AcrR family transcriptional regulator